MKCQSNHKYKIRQKSVCNVYYFLVNFNQKEETLKKIDVFIDCEGFGISFSLDSSLKKTEFLNKQLGPALNREGFESSTVAVFASYGRSSFKWEPAVKKELWRVCHSYGWDMRWTSDIADTALIDYAKERLANGTLADTVLLIANDHDFCNLVCQIKSSNRSVIVCGLSVNKRLRAVADKTFEIRAFLGGDPENILAGERRPVHHEGPIENHLPLPVISFGGDSPKP